MRRVNISKSYAILIGMEKYTKTKKRVDGAVGALGHTKDRVLHPEKVKAEEEARRDKSESAERERAWLEQQWQRTGDGAKERENGGGGLLKRLTGKLRISGKKEKDATPTSTKQPERAERERGVAGTGPEDGVPPPEGTRRGEVVAVVTMRYDDVR